MRIHHKRHEEHQEALEHENTKERKSEKALLRFLYRFSFSNFLCFVFSCFFFVLFGFLW